MSNSKKCGEPNCLYATPFRLPEDQAKMIIGKHIESLHPVDKITDVNAKNGRFLHSPALLRAVRFGMIERCKELIKRGADLEGDDDDKWSPLLCAAELGLLDISELLVSQGADLEHKNKYGNTPLDLAATNCFPLAKYLMSVGAKPGNMKRVGYKNTLMILYGAEHGDLEMVKAAVMAGVDLESNREGKTALHLAIDNQYHDVAKFLTDHGALDPEEARKREEEKRGEEKLFLELEKKRAKEKEEAEKARINITIAPSIQNNPTFNNFPSNNF